MRLLSLLIMAVCFLLSSFMPSEFLPLSAALISAATVAASLFVFGERSVHRVRRGFALFSGVAGAVVAPTVISYTPEKWEFAVLFLCGIFGYAASVEEFRIISSWLKK